MENSKKKRGLFIVFEGLDRSGKSSQVENLANYLNKVVEKPCKVFRFPDRTTEMGKTIDQILVSKKSVSNGSAQDKALHLLFSANRWEVQEEIEKTLNEGIHVISDRYSFSGLAYSMAKGLSYEWCFEPEKGLIKPDLVIFIDTDPKICAARKGYGSEAFEKIEFQQKVLDQFHQVMNQHSRLFYVIDGSKEIKEIGINIIELLTNKSCIDLNETTNKIVLFD